MRWGAMKVLAGIAVTVMLAAGCSDKQPGTALPGPTAGGGSTGSTAPTTSSSNSGAPEVERPLDATRYLSRPCTLLPASTLKELNISKPGAPDTDSAVATSVGPGCKWDTDDQPLARTYGVTIVTGNKNGLSDIYRGGRKQFPGYFEPTDVDQYPAVFNGLTDDRPNGGCSLTVGISKTVAIHSVVVSNKDVGAKACDIAKQVAAAVVQTLKGA